MALTIGKRFILHRPCEIIASRGRIPIILGSGRAFGSGDHETTRTCLEELEKIPLLEGAKVLDVGCGSGILAIAAARLGASSVLAFDPDHNAVSTAKKNIALNGVEDAVLLFQGELAAVREKNWALVMANLYGDILVDLIGILCGILVPGAFLLLSGILYEYAFDLKKRAAAHGCELVKALYLEEYTTLVFKRC